MPFLSVLLDPILPVFAILAFGFAMGRAGRTSVEAARTINRFAMSVLIPIVVFDLLANAPLAAFAPLPIALYASTQAVTFTLGYQVARRLFGIAPGEAVILAYGGIFANNVFYGLPIAVLLYGEAAVLPITMIVVLDAILSFGGTMMVLQLIERGRASPGAILSVFARTPALIAIFAGLAVAVIGLPIPAPLQTFLDFNGVAAAPVALFALGVVLSGTRFGADPAVAVFSGIKLLAFPAGIWAALQLVPGGADPRFVFGAAGPTGAMAMSLAILYDQPTGRISQVLVWTSVLTLFSLAFLA